MTTRPITVLVVDDNGDNRDMYADYLRFAGFDVMTAKDGQEALAMVEVKRPDVVALDLSMPVVDGWQVARRLKSNAKTRRVIIIALTGRTENEHMAKAKAAGCDHFIAKPCLPADVAAHIEACMKNRR